jgi:hypothetical protein
MKTATTRLMWKEFRAQRDLWLTILIGFAGIQALMLYSFTGHGAGAQIPVLQILGTLSLIGPLSFGLAAIAIAFAGEVDERTVHLLRMLPCSTRNLFCTKLATIFAGVLLLTIALVAVGCVEILCLQFSHWMWPKAVGTLPAIVPSQVPARHIAMLVSFSALMGGTSVIASLLTRRVTSAAAGGIVAAILIVWVLILCAPGKQNDFSIEAPPPVFFIYQIIIGGVLLTAAFVKIAPRWHRGLLPLPERIRTDATLPRATSDANRYSLRARIPRFSITQLFQRIAARPESSGRQTAMLAVQTLSSALPMAARWLAVSVVLFVAGCLLSSSLFPLPMILLVFFVHECGQQTFRDDQRTGAFLMLSHIGISPLRIWIVRTTVWFSMMLAVAVVFVALDALVPNSRLVPWKSQTTSLQTILGGITHLVSQSYSQTGSVSLGVGVWMGGILAVFGCGQLMACWIQRQLLAFAGSWLLLGLLYSLGIIVIGGFGWSVWLTLVPLSLCLYLATSGTARYWMDRRVTWRLRFYQAAWIIGPVLLFGIIAREAWYHVTVLNPARAFQIRRDASAAFGIARTAPQQESSTQVAEALAKLNSSITPRPNLDPNSQGFNLRFAAGLSREQLDPVVDQLERLDELPDSQAAIPYRWMAPWTNSPAPVIVCILLEDARLLQESGDGAGALRQLVRAARFSRRLSYQTSSWEAWKTCLRFERLALGRLMVVLGEVDLSNADLSRLIEDLQPLNDSTSSIEEMLNHREAFFAVAATQEGRRMVGQLVSAEPRVNAAFAGTKAVYPRDSDEFGMLSNLSDAEGLRAWKVMLLSSEYLRNTALCRFHYRDANPYYNAFIMFPEVGQSVPLHRIEDSARGVWIGDELDDFLITEKANIMMDTIALERAAVLSIRLHQYRLQHGIFPDSLLRLPSLSPVQTTSRHGGHFVVDHLDPWTGTFFVYAPQGIGKPYPIDRMSNNDATASIDAGQPMLIAQSQNYRDPILRTAGGSPVVLKENSIVLCGLSHPPEWLNWQVSPEPESQP